jgi:prepilin-type N-terminal cleavage/methylation domain-containing protein
MKKTAGFTIAEVLITLTIAGILAAIAIPSFSWLIRDTRFTTEANSLVGAFNLARSEAAKGGSVARIDSGTGTTAWGSGWTLWVDQGVAPDGLRAGAGTVDDPDDDTETLREGNALKSPLTLTAAAGVVSIQYQSIGVAIGRDAADAAVAAPYTFDLCNGEPGISGRRVTISLTGHVSAAKFSCP